MALGQDVRTKYFPVRPTHPVNKYILDYYSSCLKRTGNYQGHKRILKSNRKIVADVILLRFISLAHILRRKGVMIPIQTGISERVLVNSLVLRG